MIHEFAALLTDQVSQSIPVLPLEARDAKQQRLSGQRFEGREWAL
ncbi:MAG TPA: hypothetical protein VFB37_10980 [Steroidobacteraceae bacterium]|nr:hypothetical protein [Steroidobacteraceae bacterium]